MKNINTIQLEILRIADAPKGFIYRIQAKCPNYHKAFKLLLKSGLIKKEINCYRTTKAGKSKLVNKE